MLDIFSQFDALGLGAIAGSILFLAGLIRVLVDNSSFEGVSRRNQAAVQPAMPVQHSAPVQSTAPAGIPAASVVDTNPLPDPISILAPAEQALDADNGTTPGRGRGGSQPPRNRRPVRPPRAA